MKLATLVLLAALTVPVALDAQSSRNPRRRTGVIYTVPSSVLAAIHQILFGGPATWICKPNPVLYRPDWCQSP